MSQTSSRKRKLWISGAVVLALLLGLLIYLKQSYVSSLPIQPGARINTPSPLATWPWPEAVKDVPHRGVTHWLAHSPDGTVVELFDFDFTANPHLRLEIFDQDEDDEKPFDNVVHYWPRGVAQTTRQLNAKFRSSGGGKVVAAWNGVFFGYYEGSPSHNGTAFHVSPVVLRGKVYHNTGNHRWAFGVKYEKQHNNGRPVFKVFHLPDRETLAREFDFAAGAVQCLILNGKPLKLQPFPKPGEAPLKQPVPSTPQEAGHIPIFDHMKTCRVSMGWSRGAPSGSNRHLYLLFVKEPDFEAGSAVAMKRRLPIAGGWTVPDVQRFWQAMVRAKKIWSAVNSDAGDVAQLVYLRPDGRYIMVPPRWTSNDMRLTLSPDFRNAPQGGSLMYFYVRDTGGEVKR